MTFANSGTYVIGGLSGSGNLALGYGGSRALALSIGGNGIYSGVLSGTGGLTVAGGTEVLTGTNIYSGATTVLSAGTLQLGNGSTSSGSLNSASGIANAGALVFNGPSGGSVNVGSLISGSGSITENGNGTVYLSNAGNTFTGNVNVTSGTLQTTVAASGASVSPLGANTGGGTVTVGANGTLVLGTLNAFGYGQLLTATNKLVVNGVLINAGSNQNSLPPTLTLGGGTLFGQGGNNQYGMFSFANSAAALLNSTGNSFIGMQPGYPGNAYNGLLLSVATTANVTSGVLTIAVPVMNAQNGSNPLTGNTASLVKLGSGTLVLAAADIYNGTTTINAGVVQLSNSNALQYTLVQDNVATGGLTFANSGQTYQIGGLSGSGSIALGDSANNTLTLNIVGGTNATAYSGQLTGAGGLINSSGTLTLNGLNNTYGGATTVAGGMLVAANSGASTAGRPPATSPSAPRAPWSFRPA